MTAHPLTSRFVELPQAGRVHLLEAGEGPVVLFIHGWPTNAQLWRHIMSALAPTRRVIALDLPGFGLSDKPRDVAYTSAFNGDVLDGLLAELGVDRLSLCLHDAGGPIGLSWALRQPQRIERLCLLNTLVFPDLHWAVRAFLASVRLPLASWAWAQPFAIAATLKTGLTHRLSPEALELYVGPFRKPDAGPAFVKAVRDLDFGCLDTISTGIGVFTDIPVRLIYGARDHILPEVAGTMARVQVMLPQAELTALPELCHFIQEDDPVVVTELVAGFLGRD